MFDEEGSTPPRGRPREKTRPSLDHLLSSWGAKSPPNSPGGQVAAEGEGRKRSGTTLGRVDVDAAHDNAGSLSRTMSMGTPRSTRGRSRAHTMQVQPSSKLLRTQSVPGHTALASRRHRVVLLPVARLSPPTRQAFRTLVLPPLSS